MQKVPFIDLSRYEPGFLETLLPKVETLLRKTQFVGGAEVEKCESNLANFEYAKHAVACANGTDAIQIALRAAGVGKGDNVLLPDLTFWATFESIVNVGGVPCTLDIDPQTIHVSAKMVAEGIEKFKPKALLLVHLYGWAAPDTLAIRKLCQDNNVKLIEDGAQCFGAKINGQSVIGSSWLSTTSFYPAKVLGASGDAGALFSSDPQVAKTCKQLTDHGRTSHYSYGLIGWNSRMGAYEATFLNHSLPYLNERIASRKKVCALYRQELKGLSKIKFLAPASGVEENGYLSVALCPAGERDKIKAALLEKGISTGVVYPSPMSQQECSGRFLGGKIDHGHTLTATQSLLNLPCFAHMSESETAYVIEQVKKIAN